MKITVVLATRFTRGGEARRRGDVIELPDAAARSWIARGYAKACPAEGSDLGGPEPSGSADPARDPAPDPAASTTTTTTETPPRALAQRRR